jgi:asparagine synthase (glutamine-hydrolysing)
LGIGSACRLAQAAPCDADESMPRFASALDELLYLDQTRRLPDNMLTKVDRASMAVSLEVRVPLLDNRILDCSWSLPDDQLIRNGEQKAVLRNVLARHVPRRLFDTPKKGFHIPMADWLAENLRAWADDLLNDELEHAREYLDTQAVRKLWARYLAGAKELINAVWIVLMFLAWNRTLRENAI